VQVQGFGQVSASAGAGGSDTANLFDSPGSDLFTALADGHDALDYQTAGHIQVTNFASVAVMAGAGTDIAYLAAHAGTPNTFTARPTTASLSGGGSAVSVAGFKTVRATTSSSADVAYLYDSTGDDVFVGTPGSGSLQSSLQGAATSYFNVAVGFSQVYASSTMGNDVATLFDSAGNDQLVGRRAFNSPNEA